MFLDWFQTVERVFEYKQVPNEKKVNLVSLKLGKYASIWWSNVVAKRDRKRKSKIKSSKKMRKKLKVKYVVDHYLQDNFLKLHNLKEP